MNYLSGKLVNLDTHTGDQTVRFNEVPPHTITILWFFLFSLYKVIICVKQGGYVIYINVSEYIGERVPAVINELGGQNKKLCFQTTFKIMFTSITFKIVFSNNI